MPKTQGNTRRTRDERDRLIRHHCEEAVTHIGMVMHLNPKYHKAGVKINLFLKSIWRKHGGGPNH